MRAIGVASAALLATATAAAAAVTFSAPTAVADDGTGIGAELGTEFGAEFGAGAGAESGTGTGTGSDITSFGFSVSPETVAPGGTVTLKSDGCEVPSVTVSSGVFDTVTLNEGHAGKATVDLDAKVGAEYVVTFDCKGEKGTTMLTIAGGSGHSTGGDSTGGHTAGGTDTGAHKGVRAGFGGGFGEFGTAATVTGSVLIAGALGGAVVLIRRRGAHGRA